jgi:RNA polymerase sigma-70 factor (ECF subfamily)
MLRTRQDAEEVAQEALARAWRSRHSCRNPAAPIPWCLQITRNEALRMIGRRRSVPALEELDVGSELADDRARGEGERALARVELRRALRTLTPQEQTLIALRYTLDYSHPQIAATLDIPEATARIRLYRAHKRLRAQLVDPD